MSVDLSPAAVERRLRQASAMSDLDPRTRLDAKLDMSPVGIAARLREAAELLDTCLRLRALAPPPLRPR